MKNKETQIIIVSDTHFNHKKIISYGRVEDYEKQLKKNLKKFYKSDCFLIHLGDVCIGKDDDSNKFFKDLKINRVLVRGNHDEKSLTFYSKYWNMVCDELVIESYGKRILFSHAPLEKRDGIDLNIHGHLHTMERSDRVSAYPFYDDKYHKLISMEYLNYKPVLLKDFIK
jgi:calcineurin-like phosphoesterase family protein